MANPRKYTKKIDLPKPPEKIKRLCLKCDREFMASGRFNRICPLCQISNRDLEVPRYVTKAQNPDMVMFGRMVDE